jgi:hypothetical protein
MIKKKFTCKAWAKAATRDKKKFDQKKRKKAIVFFT